MAPTSVAIGLIRGDTKMHTFSGLSKYFDKYNSTGHLPEIVQRAQTFIQSSFDVMHLFLFDEVSMMNRKLVMALYYRIREVYAVSNLPFSGKHVICQEIPTNSPCVSKVGSCKRIMQLVTSLRTHGTLLWFKVPCGLEKWGIDIFKTFTVMKLAQKQQIQ